VGWEGAGCDINLLSGVCSSIQDVMHVCSFAQITCCVLPTSPGQAAGCKCSRCSFTTRFRNVARILAWLKPLPPPPLQEIAPQNEAEQWLHDLQACMRRTVVVAEVRWTSPV